MRPEENEGQKRSKKDGGGLRRTVEAVKDGEVYRKKDRGDQRKRIKDGGGRRKTEEAK